jgi:hypothetical protein
MPSVFDKLNLKDHDDIVVLNAPSTFEPELAGLQGVRIRRSLGGVTTIAFTLAFVQTKKDLDALAGPIAQKAEGDAIVWFAYPKATSKTFTTDITRDRGWDALGKAGFETVRLIAIDEDWSAKRLRRAEFIKTLTRSPEWAMTAEGKRKASKRAKAAKATKAKGSKGSKGSKESKGPSRS